MVITRKFFLSFAAQDAPARDLLVMTVRESGLPLSFSEIAIKVPEDSFWQQHCRSKIMHCDALLVLLSENTVYAKSVLWEVTCARQAAVPVHVIRVTARARQVALPTELQGLSVYDWRDDGMPEFLGSL